MELIKACKELLIRQPFYGIFLLNLNKELVPEDHKINTLAVGQTGLGITLWVNTKFWNGLTDDQQLAVLQHELMHICLFHLTENFQAPNRRNMNIAMDCEINQMIKNLPPDCVTLEGLSKKLGKPLNPKAGSWYYYNQIEDFVKEHPEQCEMSFDGAGSHEYWPDEEMSEAEKTIFENQIKSQIKDTADQIKKQAGHIPGEIQGILEKLKDRPPVFNWKKYLRRCIGNAITSDIKLTRMRPSKRFPDARGIRFKRKPTVLVAVDTSGSISTKDLEDFFGEINHINKTGHDVTVMEFDTKVQNVFKFDKSRQIPISGRGGTDATCAIEYYNEHKEFSTLVIFTDGYLSTFDLPVSQSMIWVITHNGYHTTEYPGKTIYIPNDSQ